MLFFFLHMSVGLVAGAFCRVQTLVMLALLVLVEVVYVEASRGPSVALWALGAEALLQCGYFGGVCARDMLERSGLALRTPGVATGISGQRSRSD
jgi:hypothetical protein